MRKINKILLVFCPLILLGGITGCNKNDNHKMERGDFVKATNGLGYLYEVTYKDYSWNDVTKWMNSETPNSEGSGFGCSSVHNGNFYGRSFDFCFTDMCEFVVRTNNENGHFASIGTAIADCNLNEEKVSRIQSGQNKTEKDILNEKMLPFTMVDGINEKGVVCNTNVVPAKDLLPHEGENKYFTHGTNPGKEDLFYQFMPRFILDNATSAKHAVELLKERNITAMNKDGKQRDYLGVSHMGYELHCMIADRNDTYIVEIVDDNLHVLHSGAYIMTNYYLTNPSPSGAGFERYSTLFDNYDEGKTLDGMKNLIHRVKYSPCYNPNWEEGATHPMWPTEFAGNDIVNQQGIQTHLTFFNAQQWFDLNWSDSIKNSLQGAYDQVKDLDDSKRATSTGGTVPWISAHACVFDIDNRAMHLVTQEKEVEGKYDFQQYSL